MKKLKGLLLGITAVCCAVGFAACGGGADSTSQPNDTESSSETAQNVCGTRAYHNYVDGKCDNCEKEVTTTEYFTFSETTVDGKKGYAISGITGGLPANVVLPDYYKKKAVLSIGNQAFYDCALVTITIPDSVMSIGENAFYSCSKLTSITIPDNVALIGDYAFSSCSKLMSITVSPENKNYQSIDGNLYDKNGKILIQYAIGKTSNTFTIPDSVTSIKGWAFFNCNSLTSVTIGNSVTWIGDYAFRDCSRLTSITIPNSVMSIGEDAFENCNNLKYNEYDDGYYFGNEENPYVVFIKPKSRYITSCIIHDKAKIIIYSAFYDCSSLTSITIPDSVTSIGDCAFDGCRSLTSVTIGNGVISIGSCAFYNCSSLTSITIPDSVTSIGDYAFRNCRSLTSVTIPNRLTSIGYYAFDDCDAFESVYYKGTAEEWDNMSINNAGNGQLENTTRYYYSESEPTESGNYWHYDENGNIVVW